MRKDYFQGCTTNEEIKKQYRRLVKILHPDNGGDSEEFKEMQQQFFRADSYGWNVYTNKAGERYEKKTSERPEDFAAAIDPIVHFEGITIEIIGSWIWVTGATFPYRETLKASGYWWSKSKKAWYHNGEKEKTRHRGHYSLDELRGRFGSEEVATEEQKKITA